MRYIICYDIMDDRRRRKVSAFLEEFAIRVQESVFVGELTVPELKKIKSKLKKMANVDSDNGMVDSVHIYPICNSCWKKVWQLGSDIGLEKVIVI